MQLHQIQPKHKTKKAPRVGRGGKRGSYSGRGQKGQKARAGRKIKPAVYGLIYRLPKLRGFKNKPQSIKRLAVNLYELNNIKKERITPDLFSKPVKILGMGEPDRPFHIVGIPVSKTAKEKIEKAGGSVK